MSETVDERKSLQGWRRAAPRGHNSSHRVAPRPAETGRRERAEALELGQLDLWEELDWIAALCGLTPTEKAVLAMARLEQYSHRKIGWELGLSPERVGAALVTALRKARSRFEAPVSPRALFWEEVRQKSRCLYHGRRRCRFR